MKRFIGSQFLYPLALTAIFALCYLRTVAPTIWFGDTAEFQVIAHLGGLGHTTGYPLYLTLAKPFSFFPLGNPALNLNIMSALFGILTVLLVYKIARELVESRLYSFSVAIIFGSGLTFWSQTSLAEVYTLHNFLFALSSIFIIAWHKSGKLKFLMVAFFLIATGLGNHLTILILIPPLALLIITDYRSHLRPNITSHALRLIWPLLSGIALVILLYYLHDATASRFDHLRAIEMMTPESWGKTAADFDSFWERMIYLVTARQFSGSMFNIGWEELSERFVKAAGFVKYNLGITGSLAGLAGLIWLVIRQWKLGLFFVSLVFCILLYNLNYGIWEFDISVYFIPVWMIGSIMIGYFLQNLYKITNRFSKWKIIPKIVILAVIHIIVLPLFLGSPQIRAAIDGHPPGILDPYLAYDSTRPVMDRIEDDAIIFCLWHQFHVMSYILLIEDKRDDVDIHEMFPAGKDYGFFPGYLNYIDKNIDQRPIYLTYPVEQLELTYRFESHPPLIRLKRY